MEGTLFLIPTQRWYNTQKNNSRDLDSAFWPFMCLLCPGLWYSKYFYLVVLLYIHSSKEPLPAKFLLNSCRARSNGDDEQTRKEVTGYGPRLAGNASSCGSGEDVDVPMGCRSHNNQPGTDPMPITGHRCPLC